MYLLLWRLLPLLCATQLRIAQGDPQNSFVRLALGGLLHRSNCGVVVACLIVCTRLRQQRVQVRNLRIGGGYFGVLLLVLFERLPLFRGSSC